MPSSASRWARVAVVSACMALLGACASPSSRHDNAPVYGGNGPYGNGNGSVSLAYGTVRSVEPIGIAQEQPQGAGAVVGGVVGAVIGRQIADSHHGRNVGTAVGAVAGAVIGNEIEKNARRDHSGARISVTLDDGSLRRFDFKEAGGLRVGDRVRVEGNMLYRVS
jgi:outer membrane lipoprotein SlyB